MASPRMHHAWILSGNKGLGKGLFARAAAAELVAEPGVPQPPVEAHPDILIPEHPPENKEEAKKLFYSYRSKNEPEQGKSSPDLKSTLEPETTEKKIAMIMDFMKETSAKLDRIEDDIAELKEKVNDILKKM